MAVKKNGGDLAKLRADRGYTQRQFSKLLRLDQSQVSRYELGRNEPSLRRFRQMRKLLGVSAEVLLSAIDRSLRNGRVNGRRAAA